MWMAIVAAATLGGVDEFQPAGWSLLPGSALIDVDLGTEEPLQGTFVRTRLAVRIQGWLYSLTGVHFTTPSAGGDPRTVLRGWGTLHIREGSSGLESSLSLETALGEVWGVPFQGLEPGGLFESMEITLEGGKFRLRLLAAPDPSLLAYRVELGDPTNGKGSFLVDDCPICGRPTILSPVVGSFLLRRTGGAPGLFDDHAVESLDVRSADDAYRVLGGGAYRWGGEVALLQEMRLTVAVKTSDADAPREGVVLRADPGPFPDGAKFPDVEIRLDQVDPPTLIHVYSLFLSARPVEPAPAAFRRGDANGDGAVDVSDPIAILFWRFAGAAAPGCLEAADADGDGGHDLTDAVHLLLWLFQSGSEPPAPGPRDCGTAPAILHGCDMYSSC